MNKDWKIVIEAEQKGYMVEMSLPSVYIEKNQTALNKELEDYFKQRVPNFVGVYTDDDGEKILLNINNYLDENHKEMREIWYRDKDGSKVYLVPITENLHLTMLLMEDCYENNECDQYVVTKSFLITDHTTYTDVDILIDFIRDILTI